jgi:hypothetical protein
MYRNIVYFAFPFIQAEDKQNKNTTQHVLDTTIQKQTTHIRRELFYKELEVKLNRTLKREIVAIVVVNFSASFKQFIKAYRQK